MNSLFTCNACNTCNACHPCNALTQNLFIQAFSADLPSGEAARKSRRKVPEQAARPACHVVCHLTGHVVILPKILQPEKL